jgi:hypothetical protein
MKPQMRPVLLALVLSTAFPADADACHRYTRWHYHFPQRCGVGHEAAPNRGTRAIQFPSRVVLAAPRPPVTPSPQPPTPPAPAPDPQPSPPAAPPPPVALLSPSAPPPATPAPDDPEFKATWDRLADEAKSKNVTPDCSADHCTLVWRTLPGGTILLFSYVDGVRALCVDYGAIEVSCFTSDGQTQMVKVR